MTNINSNGIGIFVERPVDCEHGFLIPNDDTKLNAPTYEEAIENSQNESNDMMICIV